MGVEYFNGVTNFDDLFDPDVVGDGPVATGYFNGAFQMHYAAAKYGSPGQAVDIFVGAGPDMGPQWARKGTASYSLPINGETFTSSSGTSPGPTGSNLASINFQVDAFAKTYTISTANKSVVTPINTGPIPAGAAYLQITPGGFAIDPDADRIYGGTVTNTASSPVSIVYTSGSDFEEGYSFIGNTVGATNPNNLGAVWTLTIVFFNSALSPISTTTITFRALVFSGE